MHAWWQTGPIGGLSPTQATAPASATAAAPATAALSDGTPLRWILRLRHPERPLALWACVGTTAARPQLGPHAYCAAALFAAESATPVHACEERWPPSRAAAVPPAHPFAPAQLGVGECALGRAASHGLVVAHDRALAWDVTLAHGQARGYVELWTPHAGGDVRQAYAVDGWQAHTSVWHPGCRAQLHAPGACLALGAAAGGAEAEADGTAPAQPTDVVVGQIDPAGLAGSGNDNGRGTWQRRRIVRGHAAHHAHATELAARSAAGRLTAAVTCAPAHVARFVGVGPTPLAVSELATVRGSWRPWLGRPRPWQAHHVSWARAAD